MMVKKKKHVLKYTILVAIIGTHEISVDNVECLLKRKSSLIALVYRLLMVDKEQQFR